MKITTVQAAFGPVLTLLSTQVGATVHHRHKHLHHQALSHSHASSSQDNENYSARNATELQKRGGGKSCDFPKSDGMVAVTPGEMNAGWALAPDRECAAGTWCPFACPPGKLMNQWKPDTSYNFPDSTYGGLYCNDDGELEYPFEGKPCCVDGTGSVEVVNKCGDVVSFCQTTLPGYEEMVIANDIHDTATIAVPDPSYWASTAAHYYINPPGVGSEKGCVWGDESKPIGNWAPYVAGANAMADGSTFVKLGLNPIWEESALSSTKPDFGLEIECPDSECNGLPCKISGDGVVSNNKASGAGGSDFCVVTVPKGAKANIVVSFLDGSGGDSTTTSAAEPTTSAPPTSTAEEPTTTSTPTSTTTPTTSSIPTTSSSFPPTTSSQAEPSTTSAPSSSSSDAKTSSTENNSGGYSTSAYQGGIFQENRTSTSITPGGPSSTFGLADLTTAGPESKPTETESDSNENAGSNHGGGPMAGLIIALVAAGIML